MFAFLTTSGILPKHHVFYEQVHSFCSSAVGLVDEHVLSSIYPTLSRFQKAIQFNCKPMASYLLSGHGKHRCGRTCHQTPQEYVDNHNLSFVHPHKIIRNSPPGHLTSGVIKEDVEISIQMCVENDALSIKNVKMRGYLCRLSTCTGIFTTNPNCRRACQTKTS